MNPPIYRPKGIPYNDIPSLPTGWVRVADHKEKWEKLRAQARGEAERLARHLAAKWPLRRVWLFGSVAGVWNFTEWSDIDLAAEGLAPDQYFKAWSELEEVAHLKLRVDLRCREDFPPGRWEQLIPTPVLLYERPRD